jgi:hypothetical protein
MRIRVSLFVAAACVGTMAAPAWAKQLSAPLDLSHITKLESVTLKPGQYRLEADEATGQVKVLKDSKVVAQVQGKWVSTPKKAPYSEFVMNNNDIQEVTFAGKDKKLEFSE